MARKLQIKSASEQVADHLREEIARGTWKGTMPGETQLLAHLGVGRDTIKVALSLLEKENLLVSQGPSRRRRIVLTGPLKPSPMRIGILCYDENDRASRLNFGLLHALAEIGHTAFIASKSLENLRMDARQVSGFVKQTEACAWIVIAGSRQVLEWFAEHEIPVFAIYGGQIGLAVAGAGPNHGPALRAAVRRLAELGHRKIVSLSYRGRREKGLQLIDRQVAEEMEAHGIPWSSYNFPFWKNDKDGFRLCLESLFVHTPPTALLVEEAPYLFTTIQFCGDRKLVVPKDISLVCSEYVSNFDFANPPIAHAAWDYRKMIPRIVRWAENIARGKGDDKRQASINAKFVEGGTIGPAPEQR